MSRATFTDLLANITFENLDVTANFFAYQGFDPAVIMDHLLKRKADMNISDREFVRDIKDLIVLGAVMGNLTDNNKNKISEDGKLKAEGLFTRYDLKMGGVKGNRYQVNIPRIMATFPILSVKITCAISHERNYGNQFHCSTLPKFMKSALFPAVIPKNLNESIRKILMAVCTCYTAEQTIAIKRDQTDAAEAYNNQVAFTTLTHESQFPDDADRTDYIRTLRFNIVAIQDVMDQLSSITGRPQIVIRNLDFTTAGLLVE